MITSVPVLCQQCEDPLCATMCPASAISRDDTKRVVVVNKRKCLGCRTCVEVCPFGGPSVDPRTGTAEKCDLCEGDPLCVKVCTQGALTYVAAEEESAHRKRTGAEKYLEYLQAACSEPELVDS
jgi:carbon-monoxide dehydrogenase iron sulfur subunit